MINDPIPDYIHGGFQNKLRGGRYASGATMNPQGIYGAVVYQREIQIPTGENMYLILYYPNEIHSDTHGNGGNPVMMSEIAGKNLLNGRWERWFETTKSAMGEENDLVGHIDSIVDVMYSTEMKRFRRDWNEALKTKGAKQSLAIYESKIRSARASMLNAKKLFLRESGFEYGRTYEYGGAIHTYPDFYNLLPPNPDVMTGAEIDEWVSEQRQIFSRARRKALSVVSFSKAEIASRIAGRRKKTIEVVDKYGGRARSLDRATAERYRNLAATAQRRGDIGKMNYYSQMSIAAIEPYAWGVTARNALQKAGKIARSYLVDAMLGAKAPDIVERTKKNRRNRGNPDNPPLNETGEFARSLQYVVI